MFSCRGRSCNKTYINQILHFDEAEPILTKLQKVTTVLSPLATIKWSEIKQCQSIDELLLLKYFLILKQQWRMTVTLWLLHVTLCKPLIIVSHSQQWTKVTLILIFLFFATNNTIPVWTFHFYKWLIIDWLLCCQQQKQWWKQCPHVKLKILRALHAKS